MDSIWIVIPTAVCKSKILSAEEKDFYYLLSERLTKGGYCKDSNYDLAKMLGVCELTVINRLKSLRQKKFVFVRYYGKRRLIYLNIPGEPSEEPKPTNKQIEERTENFTESIKKAIVFGTIEFNTLVEKLLESPYLENVKDNSRQFLLTDEQMMFLAEFRKLFPKKAIDCQVACFPNVNYKALIAEIRKSDFLSRAENLTLKWCLQHSTDIISGNYRKFLPKNQNFKGRDDVEFDVNLLFQSLGEF